MIMPLAVTLVSSVSIVFLVRFLTAIRNDRPRHNSRYLLSSLTLPREPEPEPRFIEIRMKSSPNHAWWPATAISIHRLEIWRTSHSSGGKVWPM